MLGGDGLATAPSISRQLFGRQTSLPVHIIPKQKYHEASFENS
jgi:hypothetical protein